MVDDSSYVVSAVSRKLGTCPDIEVIGSACNGIEAVEKVKSLKPDVVTLDIVMPVMDGLTALEHIIAECPVPVIMLSALTSENADITIKALELGAVDFFLKPSIVDPAGNGTVATALIEKIRIAAKLTGLVKRLSARFQADENQTKTVIPHLNGLLIDTINKIVVIGSSTGGPRALMQLIPALPQDLPAAVLVVQHMPPLFTKSLAQRLAQSSKIRVKEADSDSVLMNGQVLLAPGDYHMVLNEEKKINLIQSPAVQGVRSAIDVTMKSVANVFKAATLGVILTGMGCDGTEGASYIKAAGGTILAEDESTCAVYGMPMSVTKAGYTDRVVPLQSMAPLITRLCKEKTKSKVEEFVCEL